MDLRCKGCSRKLAVVRLFVGAIKCPSCKGIFEYHVLDTIHVTASGYDKPLPIKAERDTNSVEV